MNEIGTFNLVLLALVAIALVTLYIVITKLKNDNSSSKNSTSKENSLTINDLLRIVSNNSSSKKELQNALFELVDNFSFPRKINGKVPENAKPFLDFVDLLASHKNSDAKLIVLASKEIKRRNPDYSKEIDIYEERGITHRR